MELEARKIKFLFLCHKNSNVEEKPEKGGRLK